MVSYLPQYGACSSPEYRSAEILGVILVTVGLTLCSLPLETAHFQTQLSLKHQ